MFRQSSLLECGTENSPRDGGSALFVLASGRATVDNSLIANCSGSSGTIRVQGVLEFIDHSRIQDCYDRLAGGVLVSPGGDATLRNSSIVNCFTSASLGTLFAGGVVADVTASLRLYNTEINGCGCYVSDLFPATLCSEAGANAIGEAVALEQTSSFDSALLTLAIPCALPWYGVRPALARGRSLTRRGGCGCA